MRQGNEIPVLNKMIQIMEYIGNHPGKVSQPELQEALQIPQATCYRIIATLVANNWLMKSNHNHYDISSGMLPVARKVMFQFEKYKVLQPILEHLSKKVGYSSKLSICDGTEQVNVLCAKAPWDIALTTVVGTRDQLIKGGSVGTIFMSSMSESEFNDYLKDVEVQQRAKLQERIDDFRLCGYAFKPSEPATALDVKWHVDALSVPVMTAQGKTLGVLTLLSMPGELEGADHESLAKEMKAVAAFCVETME